MYLSLPPLNTKKLKPFKIQMIMMMFSLICFSFNGWLNWSIKPDFHSGSRMHSALYVTVGWSVIVRTVKYPTSYFSHHQTFRVEIPALSFLWLNVSPVPVLTLGRSAEVQKAGSPLFVEDRGVWAVRWPGQVRVSQSHSLRVSQMHCCRFSSGRRKIGIFYYSWK